MAFRANCSACHVLGNSVGGLLATHLAVRYPHMVQSLVLVNPTPIWGCNWPGWCGRLPGPPWAESVGAFLYDRIRDRSTIAGILAQTYANPQRIGNLADDIREVTEHPAGPLAFASILWSPSASMPENITSFEDLLGLVNCGVLLVYGKEDPWVTNTRTCTLCNLAEF